MTLTKPFGSPAASAFASARNGNRPTLIGIPAAFAFSSVRPQLAISGEQYVHAGIVAYGTGSACTPAIISATYTPSADATCASPRPITSPIAQRLSPHRF